jgi:hypothetical protein
MFGSAPFSSNQLMSAVFFCNTDKNNGVCNVNIMNNFYKSILQQWYLEIYFYKHSLVCHVFYYTILYMYNECSLQ